MNIYASSLSTIAQTKSVKLNGSLCGTPADFLKLKNAISAIRLPAYSVYAQRFDNAKNNTPNTIDLSALYASVRALCDLVGEVNGAPIHPENVAELMVAQSFRVRVIDLTPEMAHAHAMLKVARDTYEDDQTEENATNLENWKTTCKALEMTPGNCRDLRESVTDATFVSKIARLMGAVINEQQAKSVEEIMAEEAARKEKRKAQAKARKDAKKAAK